MVMQFELFVFVQAKNADFCFVCVTCIFFMPHTSTHTIKMLETR
jgi:hypothetical protein